MEASNTVARKTIANRSHWLRILEADYQELYSNVKAILNAIEWVPSDVYNLGNPSNNFLDSYYEGILPPVGLDPSSQVSKMKPHEVVLLQKRYFRGLTFNYTFLRHHWMSVFHYFMASVLGFIRSVLSTDYNFPRPHLNVNFWTISHRVQAIWCPMSDCCCYLSKLCLSLCRRPITSFIQHIFDIKIQDNKLGDTFPKEKIFIW